MSLKDEPVGSSDRVRTTQRHSPHIKNDEERLVARIIELATGYGRYGIGG